MLHSSELSLGWADFFIEISIIDLNLNNVYLVKDVLTIFRREGCNLHTQLNNKYLTPAFGDQYCLANYGLGQVVYTINTGTNGSAAQGVLQPYEISVVTAIEEAMDISIEMVVYPNPATDFFKLRIKNYDIQQYLISANQVLLLTECSFIKCKC